MKVPYSLLRFGLLGFLASAEAYWLADIDHQGLAPYAVVDYKAYRNVKDYGAVGDGKTDDTVAINKALTDEDRCNEGCGSATTTPAIIYFPAGTYVISSSLLPPYMTQIIGDPTNMPTLKARSDFKGMMGLIDSNPYYNGVSPNWTPSNVFYHQIRNLIIDTTAVSSSTYTIGIHWPSSQATRLQNIKFKMPSDADSQHVGLYMEKGSGGMLNDLVFEGGGVCADLGNQQYTARNFTFRGCSTAIQHSYDWSWTYIGMHMYNCGIGIDLAHNSSAAQRTTGMVVLDSDLHDVKVGFRTGYSTSGNPPRSANSLVLENIVTENVPSIVQTTSGSTILEGSSGGTKVITAWSQGHAYGNMTKLAGITKRDAEDTVVFGKHGKYSKRGTLARRTNVEGIMGVNPRPDSLLVMSQDDCGDACKDGRVPNYYYRSKPQYENLKKSDFLSTRNEGAPGDGLTDVTAKFQAALNKAVANNQVLYIDHGIYLLSDTITVPPGARIVGEAHPVLLAASPSGGAFQDINKPKALLRIGATSGQEGTVELSDFILGSQGAQPGAILIEYNLAAPDDGPPGALWDVHTRIGGYSGSYLSKDNCPQTANVTTMDQVKKSCIAAYMSMHITKKASRVYLDNTWFWTADHDMDDHAQEAVGKHAKVTIYAGRGLLVNNEAGTTWLYGTGSEHHTLYQYQFADTKYVFASMLQSESPYFQPSPPANIPYSGNQEIYDPDFEYDCDGQDPGLCMLSWGLRVVDTCQAHVYGTGHYAFYNDYHESCANTANNQACQKHMIAVDGDVNSLSIFSLGTVGTQNLITRDGEDLAPWSDNQGAYVDLVAVYNSD